jgi:hypothetical protein
MNASQEHANMGPDAPQAPPSQPGAPPYGAHAAQAPPSWVAPRWSNGRKSPALAGILSGFMPGLGQVYLGYYQRGFLHAMVFAGVIAALASGTARGAEPLFGIFMGFFYLYNIVDAVRRASLYNQALAGMNPVAPPEDFKMPSGRPSLLGGLLLTAIGFIFLMHTRFDFDLDWLADWWPAILVLLGAHMVYRATRDKKA